MKKSIFVILSVCTTLLFSSCLLSIGDFPGYYDTDDYEWTEITQEEAFEYYSTLDLTTKLHKTAKVKEYHPRNNTNRSVSISYHENKVCPEYSYYYFKVMSWITQLTPNPDSFRSTEDYPNPEAKYYVCKTDDTMIKVTDAVEMWWDTAYYQNGWLVQGMKDNAADNDYEYYYIKYKD